MTQRGRLRCSGRGTRLGGCSVADRGMRAHAWRAGTLTQNRMAASALWACGRQYDDLSSLLNLSARLTYTGDDDSSPLGLDAQSLGLLTDGIALNSTAELRAGDGARVCWRHSILAAPSSSLPPGRAVRAVHPHA